MYNLLLSGIPLNIDWRQILLHLLNLVILFLILYFLLYNPIKKFIDKRKKYYADMDERTRSELEAAQKQRADYDKLLSDADDEISARKRIAIAEARAESERIIRSAEDNAAAILKKANLQADEIKQRVEQQAKDALADVITKAAKETIETACSVDGFLAGKR